MKNTIKSLVGGLALATATAFSAIGADTNTANLVEFRNNQQVSATEITLRGVIGGANERTYKVQYCTNLVEGVWIDSTVNTNLHSIAGRTTEFYAKEPKTTNERFYRLKQNDIIPNSLSITKSSVYNRKRWVN